MLVGYQRLDTSGLDLIVLLERLETVRVPVHFSEWLSNDPVFGYLDGTRYELVTQGVSSTLRLSWAEEGPEAWHDLTTLARELICTFEGLRPLDA
jgi:hypothetical protein